MTKTLHLETVRQHHTQDLTGRVAAVTGTTSGTGYVCARELARLGATVLLLNRPSDRSSSSLQQLKSEAPGGGFDAIDCDLQDFASVRAATADILARYDRLDILCNNAGVMALKDAATRDGYCVQMQTNAISHFLLTKGLFGLLRQSDDARIVNHSSMARLGPPLEERYFGPNGGDLGGDDGEGFNTPRWARYHQTKLANAAFTYELKARLEAAGLDNVKALLAHPGLSRTQLQVTTARDGGMELDSPFMDNAQTAEDGALGILRACADPAAKTGDFYGPPQWSGFPGKLQPEELLTDPENRRITWEGCEAAVGAFQL